MVVPTERIRLLTQLPPRADAEFVLYWMIAARRGHFNFALSRGLELAREHARPLLILEALRVGYTWASDRLHAFVLEGMRDNQRHFAERCVSYYPYVEPEPGAGSGLLEALASRAVAVVTDDYPAFFLPRMLARAAEQVRVRFEAVDGNGLLPLSFAGGRSYPTAYAFRRYMQKNLERALSHVPAPDPLLRARLPELPAAALRQLERRYPRARLDALEPLLSALPIDHTVGVAPHLRGGHTAARSRLQGFLERGLPKYHDARNHPDEDAASGLSPYLHFGHIGTHEVFHALCKAESWDGIPRGDRRAGTREGFWGLSPSAEGFLDELVTWRELAYNTAATLPDYERYDSLPAWARTTLAAHAKDPRPTLYTLKQLERAETYDEIWNAAQRELVREGRMHNYLRMLWGKKILEWSKSPREALERMVELNNKYAVDGRDPNSYAGICWVLGRYDRPWGPLRPIFGSIRYMSSDATRKKLKLREYLKRHAPDGGQQAGQPPKARAKPKARGKRSPSS
ncbi:MAG TPA: deoxyribodipyrimidine photolyase [Polyangiales bacterium]